MSQRQSTHTNGDRRPSKDGTARRARPRGARRGGSNPEDELSSCSRGRRAQEPTELSSRRPPCRHNPRRGLRQRHREEVTTSSDNRKRRGRGTGSSARPRHATPAAHPRERQTRTHAHAARRRRCTNGKPRQKNTALQMRLTRSNIDTGHCHHPECGVRGRRGMWKPRRRRTLPGPAGDDKRWRS